MTSSSSRIIPKELLKFRLDRRLERLKQVIETDNDGEEENKFQLYQRILSWFIMGRLAKSEYDGILENILITTELIELHNKIIELLRAIYCDSSSILVTNEINSNSSISSSFDSFLNSFEYNLLPSEQDESDLQAKLDSDTNLSYTPCNNDLGTLDLECDVIIVNSNLKTRNFNTSIENLGLTTSEEAMISEAMRNPIHDIASIEREVLIPGINYKKSFDINFDCGNRSCTEISSLPDQNLMKSRFLKIAATSTIDENSSTPTISDSIAILACKALEDYMKNLLENAATIKFGHQTLLRPPISYIFPNVSEGEGEGGKDDGEIEDEESTQKDQTNIFKITEKDLNLLFKLKPWLLGDMESDLLMDELLLFK